MTNKVGTLEGAKVPEKGPAPTPSDIVRIDGDVWQVKGLFYAVLVCVALLVWIAFEVRAVRTQASADAERIIRRKP